MKNLYVVLAGFVILDCDPYGFKCLYGVLLIDVPVVVSVFVVPSLPVANVAVPVVVVAAAVVAALSSGQPVRPIANIVTSARRIIIFLSVP